MSGCGRCSDKPVQARLYPLKINDTVLYVELANTLQTRSKGLMFREKLNKNQGMLFVFDDDNFRSFWMKNTKIPLSIAYIKKDGRITDILNMQPYDLRSYKSSRKVRYALEANKNWFAENGIKINDRVKIPGDIFQNK